MTNWTRSPDVHIEIASGRRRRATLEQGLRAAIREGRLASGSVLPSSRDLARDLGIARGTVIEAYEQLRAEGYIVTRPRAGTFVADGPFARPRRARLAAAPRIGTDLRPGVLDLATTFPRREWARAMRAILHTAPNDAFDYGDPRGRPELREALSSYLARARGVVAPSERIVICSGFGHGLSLVARALRADGATRIAMEDPCLAVHRTIVEHQGLAVAAVPVDDDGVRPASLPDVRALVVTPAHQYPTGATLAPSRRSRIVAWARHADAFIVEDDYDGEFRYDRHPVGAIQGLAPDHVVYAGTTSKTLAPGVRVGWLVVPGALLEAVVDENRMDRGGGPPSSLEQLALAELLNTGQIDRHLRRLRAHYRKRRDAVVGALAAAFPKVEPSGIAAGLHAMLPLDRLRTTEDRVRAVAEARSLALSYLGPHWHDASVSHEEAVIVGYARPSTRAFPRAVGELVDVLREASTCVRSM